MSAEKVVVDAITGDRDLPIGRGEAAMAARLAVEALDRAGLMIPKGYRLISGDGLVPVLVREDR